MDDKELVARLHTSARGDHARGCDGRSYSCQCGFDEAAWEAADAAADRIEALTAEAEALAEALRAVEFARMTDNGSDWLNATKLAAAALKAWGAIPPANPE